MERWDSTLYEDRHSFVWKQSEDLIDLLEVRPGERILDLGCGTGHLTFQIAARGAQVAGLDSSASMIAQARQNYPGLKFVLADARAFRLDDQYDAVLSNAALHWIREADAVVECVARALRPGGRFVLEMGGKGNIQRIVAVLESVLKEHHYTVSNPWYFPSEEEYEGILRRHGFEVTYLAGFDRWNKLEHPEKGLREWLEMFTASWFESVPSRERPEIVQEIEARLRPQLWCDGAWWADYRRLRAIAVRLNQG